MLATYHVLSIIVKTWPSADPYKVLLLLTWWLDISSFRGSWYCACSCIESTIVGCISTAYVYMWKIPNARKMLVLWWFNTEVHPHMLHVWNTFLHLGHWWGKCWSLCHTWSVWDLRSLEQWTDPVIGTGALDHGAVDADPTEIWWWLHWHNVGPPNVMFVGL